MVGVDLLPVRELGAGYENVRLLQGDFLASETQERLSVALMAGKAASAERDGREIRVNTVLSDMMANMTGVRVRDVENSLELCGMALHFARKYLKVDKGVCNGMNDVEAEDLEGAGEEQRSVGLERKKGKSRESYPGGNLL